MFIGKQNGKIKFYVTEPLPQFVYQNVEWEETNDEYVLNGDVYVLNDDSWKEEQRKREQDRINNLTMTALDFVTFLKKSGLTSMQIKSYLDANIDLDMQLKYCQNVFCGVVKQLCPLEVGEIIITADAVEYAFRLKHGEVEIEDSDKSNTISDEVE